MNKKVVALVLACVLIFSTIVAGTLAYLMDKTQTVTNTFTFGKVDIDLAETTGNAYDLVPGKAYAKDPKVTVKADSENSWVFVQATEANNLANFVTYNVNTADGEWKQLKNGETPIAGVYYREYTKNENADVTYNVLTAGTVGANGQVTCKSEVTNEMINAIDPLQAPSLAFTAYAIQKDDTIADAYAAWVKVSA